MKSPRHTGKRQFHRVSARVRGGQVRHGVGVCLLATRCTCPAMTWIDANMAAGGPGVEEEL